LKEVGDLLQRINNANDDVQQITDLKKSMMEKCTLVANAHDANHSLRS
jgi:hypothetical protein